MGKFFIGFGLVVALGSLIAGVLFFVPQWKEVSSGRSGADVANSLPPPPKTREELIAEALERSKEIKALYMTADVANDKGVGASRLRNHLIALATSTEINALVIDVKEVCGTDYDEKNLSKLLNTLRANNIWAIARVVTFKDASQIYAHPEWYLHRASPTHSVDGCARKSYLRIKADTARVSSGPLWQDAKGGYWLDPASEGARQYILALSKKITDLGFNEIQYDYIRFPSDGDVEHATYPAWDGKQPKYAVMKSFFEFLHDNLKEYKPDIILSADLFGYAAIRAGDVGIGQRLDDIGDNFDYVSFMVYPSHYYSGLYLPADSARELPEIKFNFAQARMHPDIVVERSLRVARDFLDERLASTSVSDIIHATSTITVASDPIPRSHVRLRPWLEDFFHDQDEAAHRPYGVQKVRMQIGGAERVEQHGWMLWNAANVYTEGALRKK